MRKWFLSLFKKTEIPVIKPKFTPNDIKFHPFDISNAEYKRRVKAGIIKEGCQKGNFTECYVCLYGQHKCPLNYDCANNDVSPKD